MYTNTIIGSYNAIANSEHGAIIMKPPTTKRSPHPHPPPKKTHSREAPTSASSTPTQRSHSEESGGPSRVTSPETSRPPPVPALLPPNTLPGLELLLPHVSVHISPDTVFSPEVRKMGFTVEGTLGPRGGSQDGEGEGSSEEAPLLKCLPSDNASSRSLLIQTAEGRTLLTVNTPTPYCCSWYKSIEAKILRPEGGPFGLIEKTAFGPCKCSRSFRIGLEGEEETWKAEVVLTPTPHFVIKATGREDIVGTVTSQRVGLRSTYNVTFSRPDIPPNVKAIVIVFAIILHIAYAEKLNTCMGMCLCCCAGSSLAAWILCLL